MRCSRTGIWAWRLALAGAAGLAGASALAQTPASSGHLSLELGLGHEAQSSPLFQMSPQSTVVYLPGQQRLRGAHVQTRVQGFAEQALEGSLSASVAADASLKHAPQTPDLDVSSLSLQPTLHLALPGASLGWGLNLQRMNVARQHFRDVRSIVGSWTRLDGKNHWAVVAETGHYRHRGALSDLDARASSLVLQRHLGEPLPGIEGLDLAFIAGRERNDRGFRELSHRSAMLTATVQWNALGAHWSAGGGWQRVKFDDTAFAEEPVRRDRTTSVDLGAQWPLSDRLWLNLELNDVRNTSTTRLYGNHYRQFSVSLRTTL